MTDSTTKHDGRCRSCGEKGIEGTFCDHCGGRVRDPAIWWKKQNGVKPYDI